MTGVRTFGRAESARAALFDANGTRSEGGVVLLETTIVAAFLIMFSFCIIDVGMLLRNANEAADAVRSGARVGSGQGNNADADFQILRGMQDSDQGLAGDITKVVIFKANAADGQPTGSCKNFVAVVGSCNVYNASDVASQSAVLAKSGSWSPASRSPGADFIGVMVQADHKNFTKILGTNKIFGDKASVRLEQSSVAGSASAGRIDGMENGSDRIPPEGYTNPNEDPAGSGGTNTGGPGKSL